MSQGTYRYSRGIERRVKYARLRYVGGYRRVTKPGKTLKPWLKEDF